MSSLFGNATSQAPSQGTGLFGTSTTAPAQTQGTGLFGASTNNQQNQNQSTGTSLFGGNATNTQNQSTGTGLFGASTNNQQQPSLGGSLFGGNVTQTQQQQPQQSGTGLFGSLNNTNNTNNNQTQTQSTGLFGASQNQSTQNPGSSLFGAPQQPAAQANNAGVGAAPAGQSAMNPNASLFPQLGPNRLPADRASQHPQQTHLSSLLQSGLGGNPSAFGSLGAASQHDIARNRLAAYGITSIPNEKNTFEQIQTLVKKWDPNSQDTLMQTYLYNAVNAAYAPFYYRNPDEVEKDYEEALAKKPPNVQTKDGDNISYVPVLVRGFHALGLRVTKQADTVKEMRARLHEMNSSLNAIMSKHQQSLTVRLENARRQHAALSQRCLRLAVKAQVLRNRGYPLDGAEEALRKSLLGLEAKVFDPQYAAREEEIWARMVALRDRARWLEEEVRRTAAQNAAGEGNAPSGAEEITEEVIAKTKKILADYDGQIRHLGRELEEVKKEFAEWEAAQRR